MKEGGADRWRPRGGRYACFAPGWMANNANARYTSGKRGETRLQVESRDRLAAAEMPAPAFKVI